MRAVRELHNRLLLQSLSQLYFYRTSTRMTSPFLSGDGPRVRTVNLVGSVRVTSMISASTPGGSKWSWADSQLSMSSSNFTSITQVFCSLSGSELGSSPPILFDFRQDSFHLFCLFGYELLWSLNLLSGDTHSLSGFERFEPIRKWANSGSD
jgi:hypothetical protein